MPSDNPAFIPESPEAVAARAQFTPMRLGSEERYKLHLIEAALSVSDYTSKVDTIRLYNKSKRIQEQLHHICAILSGLLVAADFKRGQDLLRKGDLKENEVFFKEMFEVGRRYKVLNPDRMRSDYGKMMYLLMDSQIPGIRDALDFELCDKNVMTVHKTLELAGALAVLEHPRVGLACLEIVDDHSVPRHELQKLIKQKEAAVREISKQHCTDSLTAEDIERCLYSLSDGLSYQNSNKQPVSEMIKMLKAHFHPSDHSDATSLAIVAGRGGARLSHDHARQYAYVLQSLTLWEEILRNMFQLWHQAEADMLSDETAYRLMDTGQGLNRVKPAPRVGASMGRILSLVKSRVGDWVGSSVVHLGDHNVPNALNFIDKYTQVPRILNPILTTIREIPRLEKDPNLKEYIAATFGGAEAAKVEILRDFFRHGFDGSGADNFFDAGSCIDGRLTSSWAWCATIDKKRYYPLFKLTGFVSFDGKW